MTFYIEGAVAYLQGDWTLSRLTESSIDSLIDLLPRLKPSGINRLQIDCRHITATDTFGMQLLKVWMQCAGFRGVETELINPPDNLQHYFETSGLRYSYTDLYQNAA